MIVTVVIEVLRNTHWNTTDERAAVDLNDALLHSARRGSLLAVHLSRTASPQIAVDVNVGAGSQVVLKCDEAVPRDTHLVLRFYDWVHNYESRARREHVWCLNAVHQTALPLTQRRYEANDGNLSVVARIDVSNAHFVEAPYNAAALQGCWIRYQHLLRDFYHSAHPPLAQSIDLVNVFDFVAVQHRVAGFTFVAAPAPPPHSVHADLLGRLYHYARIRYKLMHGDAQRVDMARLCNLMLPLLSLAFPYKPDFIMIGQKRQEIDYFDDPFLSEAGDCEDLSLATLRIAQLLLQTPSEMLQIPELIAMQEYMAQFVWGLGLVSIHTDNAHMVCMGIPILPHGPPAILLESTAPTLLFSENCIERPYHAYFREYECRDDVYNYLVTLLVNDPEHPEYTFLTGAAHGRDIHSLHADAAFSMRQAVALPLSKDDIALLRHHGRDQLPFLLPSPCQFNSSTMFQLGDWDESQGARLALGNVHSYLHLSKEPQRWREYMEEMECHSLKVVRQTLTPTLDAFVVALQ